MPVLNVAVLHVVIYVLHLTSRFIQSGMWGKGAEGILHLPNVPWRQWLYFRLLSCL